MIWKMLRILSFPLWSVSLRVSIRFSMSEVDIRNWQANSEQNIDDERMSCDERMEVLQKSSINILFDLIWVMFHMIKMCITVRQIVKNLVLGRGLGHLVQFSWFWFLQKNVLLIVGECSLFLVHAKYQSVVFTDVLSDWRGDTGQL